MHEMNIGTTELLELKKLYAEAKRQNEPMFMFQGEDIMINYGKYLIEHLENELERINGSIK